VSFDQTTDPLRFAQAHARELGYFEGYEAPTEALLNAGTVSFQNGAQQVEWRFVPGDFPSLLQQAGAAHLRQASARQADWPKPHVVLFDPYSPAKNPAMWTAHLFADLFRLLDPARPCVMPTYSRSTMSRVALLLAGFWVGAGRASGAKEETTVAANSPTLLTAPLDGRWLERARLSTSAEPLEEGVYRKMPLRPETWERLRAHPQFGGGGSNQ